MEAHASRCRYGLLLHIILPLLLISTESALGLPIKDLQKWDILNLRNHKISLKNYCESWRMNVELNNIRNFNVVPGECVQYIGEYMTSTQYRVDLERAVEQSLLYLNSLDLAGDGMDAWIFDVDDTLLSSVPYFKEHRFGGENIDRASLEKWMEEMKAPALEPLLLLYNEVKLRGVKIIIITGRSEYLRDATVQNLVQAGYMGWTDLIMRGENENGKAYATYKSERREQVVKGGYRIIGNTGDQWNDVLGASAGYRTFKLPNTMYYSV